VSEPSNKETKEGSGQRKSRHGQRLQKWQVNAMVSQL